MAAEIGRHAEWLLTSLPIVLPRSKGNHKRVSSTSQRCKLRITRTLSEATASRTDADGRAIGYGTFIIGRSANRCSGNACTGHPRDDIKKRCSSSVTEFFHPLFCWSGCGGPPTTAHKRVGDLACLRKDYYHVSNYYKTLCRAQRKASPMTITPSLALIETHHLLISILNISLSIAVWLP